MNYYIFSMFLLSVAISIVGVMDAYSFLIDNPHERRRTGRRALFWIVFGLTGPLSIPIGIVYYICRGIYIIFSDAFYEEPK